MIIDELVYLKFILLSRLFINSERQIMFKIWVMLAIVIIAQTLRSDRLICVQQIIRHGSRYPYLTIKNDKLSQWATQNHLLRQLTKQGKHMHYLLGKELYKKYWKPLFGEIKQSQELSRKIYVYSTNTNRTIQSAQSQLIGFLQGLKPLVLPKDQWENSLPPFPGAESIQKQITDSFFYVYGQKNKYFHPIPVHTEPDFHGQTFQQNLKNINDNFNMDFLVKSSSQNCPNQDKWIKPNLQSKIFKRILSSPKVKKYFKTISKQLGYPVGFDLYGQVACQAYDVARYLGQKSLNIFQDPQMVRTTGFINFAYSVCQGFYSSLQRRTSSSWLLKSLINNMKLAKNNSGPKLIIYSGHDWTLMMLLTSLKLYTLECVFDSFQNKTKNENCVDEFPIFGANMMIQFWQTFESRFVIKVIYNGELKKIPVCGYKDYCTFQQFQKWVDTFYLDPNRHCGVPPIKFRHKLSKERVEKQKMNF